MVFGHRNIWLLFRILKLIYFPTITSEETYVAGGVQQNRVFSRLSQISPRPMVDLVSHNSEKITFTC